MKDNKIRVLFLCTGNSCRSQMAEGYARHLGDNLFSVRSAGIEAHGKNARAVTIMAEDEVDISQQESTLMTKETLEWANVVITLCGHADEHCPVLPPNTFKEHWPLADPAKAIGNEEEIMCQFRAIRDDIKHRVSNMINEDFCER
ncbi:MAG: arsenate reductase (thioredoxin) [Pseudomonadota bacterium]